MLKLLFQHFKKIFPKRKSSSHKGDFGKLLILSGSKRMVGCAILAAQSALQCGVGLLTLGFPKSLYSIYTKRLTESMFLPLVETRAGSLSYRAIPKIKSFLKTQDVLALGPGLSREKETGRTILELVLRTSKPMVLDADGLFPFSGKAGLLKKVKAPFVLTPHAGEFKRLFNFGAGETLVARKKAALKASLVCGGVVILKGHQTVVAASDGRIYVNRTGNAGLAKGGTGDVLFGMIASFLTQGLEAFNAACLGVFLHGLSADLAIRKIVPASLMATDVIKHISPAIRKLGK